MPALPRGRALLAAVLLSPACAALSSPVPITVRAGPLSELGELRPLRAPAEVVPANRSVLASELALPVAGVRADVGQRVDVGDVLVELDRRDPTLQLNQALAQRKAAAARLELARQRLARGRELAERQFTSADDLLALDAAAAAAEADLEIADSAVALARRTLDKTTLRAPFAGEVVHRHAQVGALAAPGSPLIELVQRSADEVEARIPQDLVGSLDASRPAQLVHASGRLPLRLLRLGESVDPASRSVVARFAFAEGSLPGGSSGVIEWTHGVPSVPAALVVQRDGQLGVFRVEQGTARFVALPHAIPGRSVSVALPADTLLVSEGQNRLQDGDPVTLQAP